MRSGAAVVWRPAPKAVARGRPTRQLLTRFMLVAFLFLFHFIYLAFVCKGHGVRSHNSVMCSRRRKQKDGEVQR